MAYVSQSEVEAHTGYTYTDFRQAGAVMTSLQWTSYLTGFLVPAVEAEINKFCARKSFESANYIEYHDGRGSTGDRGYSYRELDRVFIPREQPVTTLTSVYVNDEGETDAIAWTARTAQTTSVGGDYAVIEQDGITKIRFHSNIPKKGYGNVKITYTAGYASGTATLNGIKAITLEIVANFLARKKRDQETIAARRVSAQDSANMFQEKRPDLLTDEIKAMLTPYKRCHGRRV